MGADVVEIFCKKWWKGYSMQINCTIKIPWSLRQENGPAQHRKRGKEETRRRERPLSEFPKGSNTLHAEQVYSAPDNSVIFTTSSFCFQPSTMGADAAEILYNIMQLIFNVNNNRNTLVCLPWEWLCTALEANTGRTKEIPTPCGINSYTQSMWHLDIPIILKSRLGPAMSMISKHMFTSAWLNMTVWI